MIEERAASFTKRSIKTDAKLAGLKMVVSMMDLTTLEGKDTPGKVAYLCRKAIQPADPRFRRPELRGRLCLSKSRPCGEDVRARLGVKVASWPPHFRAVRCR
jgi:deoxyribose-phosphate aldolase